MTEGAIAIYVSLATALSVWVSIALYLWRVGSRLNNIKRDLTQGKAESKD